MKKLGLFKSFFLESEVFNQEDFKKKLRKDNVERVYLLSYIGLLFLFLLLVVDYLRYLKGTLDTNYVFQLLFYNHLALAALIIPIFIIYKNRAKIKRGRYKYSLAIIYSTIIYSGLVLLSIAILCIIDRNAMMVYGLFVLTINFVVILPHVERVIFNLLSLTIIILAIFNIYDFKQIDSTLAYINVLECVTGSILSFALSTFLYNDEVKRFSYEKILEEKNKIIKEEKEVSNTLAEKLEVLNAQKSKLYTNITHEFRTPLTVILGMSQNLRSFLNKREMSQHEEALKMIERNGNKLLFLINEMMDLSKLESGLMPLNLVQSDIIPLLRYVNESFQSYAVSKNIHLSFLTDLESFVMDFDMEKIQQIHANLLSNAIKFTPGGGRIAVLVKAIVDGDSVNLSIKVKDSGLGIVAEEIPYIFDRFYQVENEISRQQSGSGIGLALTKELVSLMGGNIAAESTPGQGTAFSITLPVKKQSAIKDIDQVFTSLEKNPQNSFAEVLKPDVKSDFIFSSKLPLILIIEDNSDVVNYLKSCLEKDYELDIAYDGQQGINKAIEIVPDIIISDIMMPGKNGYEVCEFLKQEKRTNHIPIILLTAKVANADKLNGLKSGADVYLAKPFNKTELLLRLKNLIAYQKKLQQKYEKGGAFWKHANADTEHTEIPAFLRKINTLLEKNLSDEDFGILQLCKAMAMSRSQIHRKLKALTNLSTSIYIRLFRLYKAKELLQTTEYNISEIAYQVGFKDPNYFTNVYAEEFGAPPSATRK